MDLDPDNKEFSLALPEPVFVKKIKEKRCQEAPPMGWQPSDALGLFSGEEVAQLFLLDCNEVSGELLLAWEAMGDSLLNRSAMRLFSSRRREYFNLLKVRYGSSVFKEEFEVNDYSEFVMAKMGKLHQEKSIEHRKSKNYQTIDQRSESGLNVILKLASKRLCY